MIIDLETYSANKDYIQSWYLKMGNGDINRSIAITSQVTFVPCIVCAFYLGELTNWHPDTVKAVIRLKEFYGYQEIKNIPDGSPF